MRRVSVLGLLLILGCGGGGGTIDGGGDGDGDGGGDGDSGPAADAADDCQAPDMLVLLDRTMSMHRRPDGTVPTHAQHAESKWYIAITAIEALTAQFDTSVRFGLALFPRDPGGDVCVTLSERIDGTTATNPTCEAGEVLVQPGLSTADEIATAIDPETTLLCNSTPIGAGLGTAQTALAAIQNPIRDQYVLFVGDGNDTCDAGLVLDNTQALAAAGVGTFVIAFDGSGSGIDNGLLNDMACAGRTAPGFPAPCTDDGAGNYTATDRAGPALYLLAEDAAGLTAAFDDIAGQVCCGCIP